MITCLNMISFDPYDVWATPLGVAMRRRYYDGRLTGKWGAVGLSLLDWLLPGTARRIVSAKPLSYPISVAHAVLRQKMENRPTESPKKLLQHLGAMAIHRDGTTSWGLGFPWMSKNGLYGSDIPFVTHTPYVREALLILDELPDLHNEAMTMFHGTWGFLQSLHVMDVGPDDLALSYAPVDEPRMVVNANAYAAFAYTLHAVHGQGKVRDEARLKAKKLAQWVVRQQQADGSWWYYADREPGNLIDCFHSCFVVKNLLKVSKLLPELSDRIQPVTDKGWAYIRSELYDLDTGLCHCFSVRAQRDPFKLDLYDQAEYLGLLVDFELLKEASEFATRVEKKFCKGEHWYCRIDILGRRWGKDFLRWGIVPFGYHRARMNVKLRAKKVETKI